MGLFRKSKTGIIVKFYRTDLVICSHFREEKTLSYSQINMVIYEFYMLNILQQILESPYRKQIQNCGFCKAAEAQIRWSNVETSEINRIYRWSPMQTKKSQPKGKQIMPGMRFITEGWGFLVCIK